ncbi:MAG TPA: cytochrome c biogenesis protein CcdA [Vicinamibacteria bacterium]|nr:cytochrome c biogenesis protein CcdA [Vicinamibacteria bacterium]
MTDVSLLAALAAGVISFISPCVLPIVPGYISFISGASLSELKNPIDLDPARRRELFWRVAANSLFFVLGFSVVFVAMGASATYIGQWFAANRLVLARIAGAVIIVLGLHTMGITPIKWLNYEKRVQTQSRPMSVLGSFLVGLAFAFGWSPCIGPILAGVLVLAAQQNTVSQGIALLTAYSLGLGIPFIVTGLAIHRVLGFFGRIKKHMKLVEVTAGALLIVVGVLVATDSLQALSRYFTFLPVLG